MNNKIQQSGIIITFYSYKGGTGRSMALANLATLFAKDKTKKSQKILIMDWDLEAPGLHRFFSTKAEKPKNINKPGIIDYFIELNTLFINKPELYNEISEEEGWKKLKEVIPLDNYLIFDVYKGVDFLKAGRIDHKYAEIVAKFDWSSFYDNYRLSIKAFRDLIINQYTYCLIDSRTGFTDISGICTMLLPEKLVVVFTPNKQSLYGVIDLIERAIKYRSSSEDLRPLSVFPLPSRIDDAEEERRRLWRIEYQKEFEKIFEKAYDLKNCDLTDYFDEVQLPYKSYYAYGEELAILSERDESLSLHRAYKIFFLRLRGLEVVWGKLKPLKLESEIDDSLQEQLIRRKIEIYPKVIAPIYRIRNLSRDLIADFKQNPNLIDQIRAQIEVLTNALIDFRLDLEDADFKIVHAFKYKCMYFYQKLGDLMFYTKTKDTEKITQAQEEIKNIFSEIEEGYVTIAKSLSFSKLKIKVN